MKKEYIKLELDKVLALLSEEAWSNECREQCLEIEPVFDLEECCSAKPTTLLFCLENSVPHVSAI